MKNDALSIFGIKKHINKFYSGFTIVELLVVIVVIGILAAISIVSYTGITQRAAAVTLKSDLKSSSTQLALYNTTNSIYPADLAAATTANVLPKSTDTTYQYTLIGSSYCLSATSNKAGSTAYHFSSLTGTIEDGVCEGHIGSDGVIAVNIEVLVVAGGGGGGKGLATAYQGAGGGAGGVIYDAAFELTIGEYPIIVGGGGANATSGYNSSFSTLEAIGGGNGSGLVAASIGGSGGGGRANSTGPRDGTAGQGCGGGASSAPGGSGGGGGASEVGMAGNASVAGDGGDGISVDISGSAVSYGGGGGSGGNTLASGAGGLGGGGNGGHTIAGANGQANTGGGGGGGSSNLSSIGGAGGSGIVIIRYLTTSITALSTNATKTTDGLYTIYTFTSNGTFTVN